MYVPPESKSPKGSSRQPARPAAERDPALAARAEALNARPQIRQLKEQSESLSGRPEIPALAAKAAPNRTGLPDALKAGVENLSGIAMDDVRVHYGSARPAALHAKAYAQGSDIHLAPGEERHLPHEAWHVVQQKQGRVKATIQAKGVPINDDGGLEREADLMGARAAAAAPVQRAALLKAGPLSSGQAPIQGFQLQQVNEFREGITDLHYRHDDAIGGNAQVGEHLHITVSYAGPTTRHCYYNYNTATWRWDTAPPGPVLAIAEAQQAQAIIWAAQHRPKPVVAATAVDPNVPKPPKPKGPGPRKGARGTQTMSLSAFNAVK
jgi:hypothetical protein